MEKILYQKTISSRDRKLFYSLRLEKEKLIFRGEERKNEQLLFQILADVSGYRSSYMIRFLENLTNTQTKPQHFTELLEENPDFFYSVLREEHHPKAPR